MGKHPALDASSGIAVVADGNADLRKAVYVRLAMD
jgi:hypothetical protein